MTALKNKTIVEITMDNPLISIHLPTCHTGRFGENLMRYPMWAKNKSHHKGIRILETVKALEEVFEDESRLEACII
jgi:hypothetical protein